MREIIKLKTSNLTTLSVVIPCHNSQDYIAETIKKIRDSIPSRSEIVIVENGSTDKSLDTARLAAAKLCTSEKKITVVHSAKGLGNALRHGVSLTSGGIVAFMADDLPFGTQEIDMLEDCKNSPETIFAISKYLSNSNYKTNVSRKALGTIFVFVRSMLLPTPIRDTQGSFIGNGEIIRQCLEQTREREFLITTELHWILHRNKIKVTEVPCEQSPNAYRESTINVRGMISMGTGLFRISVRRNLFK